MKGEKQRENNKKGQLTFFIIIALVIIVVLVILLIGKDRITSIVTGTSPVEQIRSCVEDSIQPAIDLLSVQGGVLTPQNYYLYQGNKVEYLCYTEENYAKCVMQKPLLKQSIEKELNDYLTPRAKNCFNSVKTSLQQKGYTVTSKSPDISVELIPSSIIVNIDADLVIEKNTKETYKSIKTDVNSNLYDLVMISSSILNWEARYGDADALNYMIYYPSIKVEKKKQDEGTTIYVLTDRNSLDKFIFASRSVAIPIGITGN